MKQHHFILDLPHAVAKLFSYWIVKNYREAGGIFACTDSFSIMNLQEEVKTFVTRKITRGLTNIAQGIESCLYMGNIHALRDWGHAKDYVEMQWMMLQQDKPKDYV